MINYDALMGRKFPITEHAYTEKDTILYALGLGLGGWIRGGVLGSGSLWI